MIQQESFQFLADLKNNNNREWFLANKKRYETYKKNYHDFVAVIIKELSSFDPGISQLDIKDCTFRINRDIRFSKDKSPYKTHMGIWLSTDKSCKNAPGYYIHFDTEKPFIAAGLYCPESSELKKVRREIAFFHQDLDAILMELLDERFELVHLHAVSTSGCVPSFRGKETHLAVAPVIQQQCAGVRLHATHDRSVAAAAARLKSTSSMTAARPAGVLMPRTPATRSGGASGPAKGTQWPGFPMRRASSRSWQLMGRGAGDSRS